MVSSPQADIKPESLIDFEGSDRNTRDLTRTSTCTSVGPDTPAELTHSSTRTSIGMEGSASHRIPTSPDFGTPSHAPTTASVPKFDSFNRASQTSIREESPKDGDIVRFCNICRRDVTYDEFHYSCDDCAVDGSEDAGDGDYGEKSANDKLNTKDDDSAFGKRDETLDNYFGVCQKCFASGLQGPDHAGHKFGKKMVVLYGTNNSAIFPHPERQVFVHDSNIVKALKEGDWTKLMAAILNGNNVNAYDTDGNTPLHLAIYLGLANFASILLNAGASRDIRDRADQTPLHNAVLYNQVEILAILLEKGADINATGTMYSDTALHLAAMNGQHDIVQILLEKGATFNVLSTVGTPLLYAAKKGHKQCALLLLEAGANPNLQVEESDGQGLPLIGAAAAGKSDTIRLLVEHGARVEDRTAEGYTALMLAAAHGHLEFCEILLRLGSNSQAKANDGRSVLAVAAQENRRDIVELLLEHGADVDDPDNDGDTPLVLAMEADQIEMVKLLRRYGAKIDQPNAEGCTLLLKAVEADEPEKVELLLEQGASVDNASAEGMTPLFLAARLNPEIVKLLLQHGATVDMPVNGKTPLIFAVEEGCTAVCEALLLAKADVNQYDSSGATPLYKAVGLNKLDIVKLLLKYGAKVDLPENVSGNTPLMLGVLKEHIEVCEALLWHKANIEQVSRASNTPLMAAAMTGKLASVKLLVRYKALLNKMPIPNGRSALTVAANAGHFLVVKYLLESGASAVPTPSWKWKYFVFSGDVDWLTQRNILQLLREYKHR